jgi:hypothetical protein
MSHCEDVTVIKPTKDTSVVKSDDVLCADCGDTLQVIL